MTVGVGVTLPLGVGPAVVGGFVAVYIAPGVDVRGGVCVRTIVAVLVAVLAGRGVDVGRSGGSVGVGASVLVGLGVRVIVASTVGVGVLVSSAMFIGRTNDSAAGEIIRLVMPRQ